MSAASENRPPSPGEHDQPDPCRRDGHPGDSVPIGADASHDAGAASTHGEADQRTTETVSRRQEHGRSPLGLEHARRRRQCPAYRRKLWRAERPDDAHQGRCDVVVVVRLDLLRPDSDDVDHRPDPQRPRHRDDGRGCSGCQASEVAHVRPAGSLRALHRDQARPERARIVHLEPVHVRCRDRRSVRHGHGPGDAASDVHCRRLAALDHLEVQQRLRAGWQRWDGGRRRGRGLRRRRLRRVRGWRRSVSDIREAANDDIAVLHGDVLPSFPGPRPRPFRCARTRRSSRSPRGSCPCLPSRSRLPRRRRP